MQTLDAICGVSATTGFLPTATGYAIVEANPANWSRMALLFGACRTGASNLRN
jgi:DNA polymerase V